MLRLPLRYLRWTFVIVCMLAIASCDHAQTAPLQVHAGIAVVVDPGEDTAIQIAASDLRRDLLMTLGAESPLLSSAEQAGAAPAIVITCNGAARRGYRETTLTEPESFSISQTASGPVRVVLQGSDVRGTIYSIYQFSEQALGVPPLWFWSGWQPHPKPSLDIKPAVFQRINTPSVRWRGWFPNDTDMLAPWLSESDEHVDLFLETLLRLRFNLLDVDHISDWDNHPNLGLVLARRCKQRGIKVTFTHLAPFGFLLGDWDKYWTSVRHMSAPPLRLSDLKGLDEFWTYAIHFVEDEHLDVIQSIEFRVDGDKPFWRTFPDAPQSDVERARVISAMLDHQMLLLRRVSRGPVPLTRTVFYNEVGQFLDAGELTPPKDPLLIWNYANEQRDHYPRPEIFHPHAKGQAFGYYLNLQFFTTGSHLTQGEGPWKVEQNLQRVAQAVKPGHLDLVVLNVGNLREFTMEISVASKLLWDDKITADGALDDFCAEYFDPALAKQIHDAYRDYYFGYWRQRAPDLKDFPRQYIFHDLRYARAAENLLTRIETGHYTSDPLFRDPHMLKIDPPYSGASDETHAIVNGTTASAQRLEAVVTIAQRLVDQAPPESQHFLNECLLSDAKFMLAANLFLKDVAGSYIAVDDPPSAKRALSAASSHLEEMQAAIANRTTSTMPDWYHHETKFDLPGMSRRLQHVQDMIAARIESAHAPTTAESQR